MSRIGRELDAALEDLHRADSVLEDRLATMRESSSSWPAGRAGSGSTGRRLEHWCWAHEREVRACHREGLSCAGEPMDASADPTGEAAASADRCVRDHREAERLVRSIRRSADRLTRLLERYERGRTPSDEERRQTLADLERNERAEACWSCARTHNGDGAPRFSPGERRVVLAGDKRPLCRWCLDWFREVGELPTPSQVDDHARGLRVRRPESKRSA